jgi:DNA invertase Pin-like site-specific DNA recombinase
VSRWAATRYCRCRAQEGVTFGRPTKVNAKQRGMLAERYARGETMAALAREFDVSQPTVWRALRSSPGESRGAE